MFDEYFVVNKYDDTGLTREELKKNGKNIKVTDENK